MEGEALETECMQSFLSIKIVGFLPFGQVLFLKAFVIEKKRNLSLVEIFMLI